MTRAAAAAAANEASLRAALKVAQEDALHKATEFGRRLEVSSAQVKYIYINIYLCRHTY